MRERPISFIAPMVRAILERKKVQTRRVVKPEDILKGCPYGRPGDRLWVRETWGWNDGYVYRVDNESCRPEGGWKSPRFMPRRAARIILEIVSVRMENLQDISNADAEAEGVMALHGSDGDSRTRFRDLWNSIHEENNRWQDDPPVWVIEFRVLDAA